MARIKTGVPTVKELLEGESEKRYIPSVGLVNYTRYNNKLFTNKMHDYPSPPLIDKKALTTITRITSSETSSSSSDAILKDGTVQLTNDWDAGPNNITTASLVTSGDISVGDDLLLTSSASVINWNSGDVTLTHASGKLTFGGDGTVELDFNNHEMTNVDIDSGAIDGTAIGASSQAAGDFTAIGAVAAGTIAGTTIDATTDFTIGTTVITDDQIQMSPTNGTFTISSTNSGSSTIATIDTTGSNGAHLLLNTQGDLIVSSNTQLIKFHDGSNYVFEFDTADVKFKMADDADTGDYFEISTAQHGATTIKTLDDDATAANLTFDIDGNIDFKQTSGTTRYTFNLDSTPELDVTGAFTLDGSSTITIDSVGSTFITTNGSERFEADTAGHIYLHNPQQTLYNDYGITMEKDLYHFTTGKADYQQNYTMLHIYTYPAASKHETYPGA